MLKIQLPLKPISVNVAFSGRHFKTPAYKIFEEAIFYLLPRNKKVLGEVKITYHFYLKNYKRADLDNVFKCLNDTLVKFGVIEDDVKIIEIHAYKFPSKEDKIEIYIEEI
jgi:Holliday junction resolvase RusA-like endonuclease